jgi:hypothetical protein
MLTNKKLNLLLLLTIVFNNENLPKNLKKETPNTNKIVSAVFGFLIIGFLSFNAGKILQKGTI